MAKTKKKADPEVEIQPTEWERHAAAQAFGFPTPPLIKDTEMKKPQPKSPEPKKPEPETKPIPILVPPTPAEVDTQDDSDQDDE